MDAVFLTVVNMSLTTSWLAVAVFLLRLLLKKAPKAVTCGLWALVGIRLVCPISIESALSLIPSANPIPDTITTDTTPAINSGVPSINAVINPVLSQQFTPAAGDSANPMQILTNIAAVLWVAGMVILLVYATVSFIRVRRLVNPGLHIEGNVYVCDGLPSPFILGLIRPRIYLPTGLDEAATTHVLAHERAHLRRHDHWWKPLGFLLLTVHWFNPVMWVAYILLCRDIEFACDERVVRELDEDGKAAYSSTLLACGARRRAVAACPLAFGEVGIKTRVRSVLNYKKPTFWIVLAAVLAALGVAIGFLTNPKADTPPDGTYRAEQSVCIVDHTSFSSFGILSGLDWRIKNGSLWTLYDGGLSDENLGQLELFTLTEENFDNYFKQELRSEWEIVDWRVDADAATLRKQTKRAWRCPETEHNEYYYFLQTHDGNYYACYGRASDTVSDVQRNYAYITKLNLTTADGVLPKTGRYELTERICHFDSEMYSSPSIASLFWDNGTLYTESTGYKSQGIQLESFTLTTDNFDAFFKSPDRSIGKMVWDTNTSAAELRKNTQSAWRYVTTLGHPSYYYLLEMKNGEFLFCHGMSDTVMHNFFDVYRIEPVEGFCATVLEVNDNNLLVEPFEGEEIRRTASKLEVPTGLLSYVVPELYNGDHVWIAYDGEVQESHPARLASLPNAIVPIYNHRDPATVGTYSIEISDSYDDHLERIYTRNENTDNDYNVYYYSITDASIIIDGKKVDLKQALVAGDITPSALLLQAKRDANANLCSKDLYDDGGSVMYLYDTHRLLLRYSSTEKGDTTTGLYDVYVMSHSGTLDTLENVLHPDTAVSIPFVYGSKGRVRNETFDKDFYGQLILNTTQLQELNLSEEYQSVKYTDTFFSENALLLLEFRASSGSTEIQINNVFASENGLDISYTATTPNPHTTDMAYWRMILVISKKNVQKVQDTRDVYASPTYVTLPSGGSSSTKPIEHTLKTTDQTTVSTLSEKQKNTAKVNPTVIVAIEDNSIIVDAKAYYVHRNDNRYDGYDRFAFDVSGVARIEDYRVGDKVSVVHNGSFTDGEPPRGKLLALSKITNDVLTTNTTTAKIPPTAKVNTSVIVAIEGKRIIVDAKDHYIHANNSHYRGYERYAFTLRATDRIENYKVGDKVTIIHLGSFTDGEPPHGWLLALSKVGTDSSDNAPPDNLDLGQRDWGKVTKFRVCHVQGEPYKAVTLTKGTKAFETLVEMLKQAKGTYVVSQEGTGGFMPIYVYEGETQVDRIEISVTENACFSSTKQQEPSFIHGPDFSYPSVYTMPKELSKNMILFLESLNYTEDLGYLD